MGLPSCRSMLFGLQRGFRLCFDYVENGVVVWKMVLFCGRWCCCVEDGAFVPFMVSMEVNE